MSGEEQDKALRISDLIEVPEIRTVIQLEDLKDLVPPFRKGTDGEFILGSLIIPGPQAVLSMHRILAFEHLCKVPQCTDDCLLSSA